MASHSEGQIALTNDRWGLEMWGSTWLRLLELAHRWGWTPDGVLVVGAGRDWEYVPRWHQTVVVETADAKALGEVLANVPAEGLAEDQLDVTDVDAVLTLCRLGAFRIYNSQVDLSTICECGLDGEYEDLPPASELVGDHLRPDPAEEALLSLAEVCGPRPQAPAASLAPRPDVGTTFPPCGGTG